MAIVAVACFTAAIFLALGFTFARYASDWYGRLGTDVAQWKMEINGVKVSDNSVDAVHVVPIPTTNIFSPEYPEKLQPGQEGYFDVIINPKGTEVSFEYSVTYVADSSSLPNGMTVDKYAVKIGESIGESETLTKSDLPADKTINGEVYLPADGIFTKANSVTVRFYWTWEAVDYDERAEYKIVVTATVRQYFGEETSREIEKGEQTV